LRHGVAGEKGVEFANKRWSYSRRGGPPVKKRGSTSAGKDESYLLEDRPVYQKNAQRSRPKKLRGKGTKEAGGVAERGKR